MKDNYVPPQKRSDIDKPESKTVLKERSDAPYESEVPAVSFDEPRENKKGIFFWTQIENFLTLKVASILHNKRILSKKLLQSG